MRATARAPLSLRLPARRPSAPASARQRPQRAAAAPLSLSRVVRSVRLAPIAAGGEKDAARKALEQALGGGNSQMAKSFDKWADDKEKQEAEWLANGGGDDGNSGKGGFGGGGGGGFFGPGGNPFNDPQKRGEWATRLQTFGVLFFLAMVIVYGKQMLALVLNLLFLPVALFNRFTGRAPAEPALAGAGAGAATSAVADEPAGPPGGAGKIERAALSVFGADEEEEE